MSTPKKIRDAYENTFRKLISTSETDKKIRRFLSSLTKPAQPLNLPIKLSEIGPNLFSSPKSSGTPSKRKTSKPASSHRRKKAA